MIWILPSWSNNSINDPFSSWCIWMRHFIRVISDCSRLLLLDPCLALTSSIAPIPRWKRLLKKTMRSITVSAGPLTLAIISQQCSISRACQLSISSTPLTPSLNCMPTCENTTLLTPIGCDRNGIPISWYVLGLRWATFI